MSDRSLTEGEIKLAKPIFKDSIDYSAVRVHDGKYIFFQPGNSGMTPNGEIYVDGIYSADYSGESPQRQAFFIHEMTHVWQAQARGRWHLPLRRHPFCRYDYALKPGWPLERYGIEQQAEIMRHAFLLSRGVSVAGAPSLRSYRALLPFDAL